MDIQNILNCIQKQEFDEDQKTMLDICYGALNICLYLSYPLIDYSIIQEVLQSSSLNKYGNYNIDKYGMEVLHNELWKLFQKYNIKFTKLRHLSSVLIDANCEPELHLIRVVCCHYQIQLAKYLTKIDQKMFIKNIYKHADYDKTLQKSCTKFMNIKSSYDNRRIKIYESMTNMKLNNKLNQIQKKKVGNQFLLQTKFKQHIFEKLEF